MLKTAIIVQARMGSRRFPQKMLRPIAGQPMVLCVLDRLSWALEAKPVILATTDLDEDLELARVARRHGYIAETVHGDPDDVMARYIKVAEKHKIDVIVRATGDCPLIDPVLVDEAITERGHRAVDYVALAREWADGLDVEVFTTDALLASRSLTETSQTRSSDREHVTPAIWRDSTRFSSHLIPCPYDLSGQRWCVDTQEDHLFIDNLYREVASRHTHFGWREVYNCIQSNAILQQEGRLVSRKNPRNQGYMASLAKDIGVNHDSTTWDKVRYGENADA
ncbi:MAG TPA: hypothetical protein VNP04_13515 [Alphaproteobacteria bacterium]|nr:hypothetical protein [Alphaproteobacteria bacterium]